MNQTDSIGSGQIDGMGEREFREHADNAPVMIWRSRTDKLCDWFNKPWQHDKMVENQQPWAVG